MITVKGEQRGISISNANDNESINDWKAINLLLLLDDGFFWNVEYPTGANLQSSASLEVADKAWAIESLFGSLGEWSASHCLSVVYS